MPSLPILAPRPAGEAVEIAEKQFSREHTEEEWEAKKGIIQQIYIQESRKLVDMMNFMESKYGFAATEQMYKKRLRKWNFRKRAYRKTPDVSVASTPGPSSDSPEIADQKSRRSSTGHKDVRCAVILPQVRAKSYADLESVLNSVCSWSLGKLDEQCTTSDPMSRYLASPNRPPMEDSRTMYRTFELVFDLWFYGKGELAGRAARKAFHTLDYVLTDDHPDLVWHILDTIYDMVDRGHIQLLGMFLAHASVLTTRSLPPQHPLVRILQQLIRCDFQTQQGREHVCYLLRTAWLQNVDILAKKVGSLEPRHLWLYEQLIWDGRTRLRKGSDLAQNQAPMVAALTRLLQMHESLNTSSDFDTLRIKALLLEYTQMDLKDRIAAEELAVDLLNRTGQDNENRSNARFHAYARKMLARIQEHRQDWNNAEENLRYAIAKREAAHGNGTDLRVIRDMWVFAALCQRSGRHDDANRIIEDAFSRADVYLDNSILE